MDKNPHSTSQIFADEDAYHPEPAPEPAPPAWQDGSVRIGIHTSIAGDLPGALDKARDLGCNALQIFSAGPRTWSPAALRLRSGQAAGFGPEGTRVHSAAARAFHERRAALALGPLVIHANYLINLASPDRVLRAKSAQALHDELVRAVALGADYLVLHPGSSRGGDVAQAREWVAEGLRQATRRIKLDGLRILLENTAGQGNTLGWRLEELKMIYDACRRAWPELPVGVCIDTAHLFAAGYDIRSAEGLEQTLQAIERTVGLASVFVVHVNDSKAPLGSRVDRHEHIGEGKIGLQAFRRILNHPLLAGENAILADPKIGRAFILETPIDQPGDDARNVKTLWELRGIEIRQKRKVRRGGLAGRFGVRRLDAAFCARRGFPRRKTRKATKKKAKRTQAGKRSSRKSARGRRRTRKT